MTDFHSQSSSATSNLAPKPASERAKRVLRSKIIPPSDPTDPPSVPSSSSSSEPSTPSHLSPPPARPSTPPAQPSTPPARPSPSSSIASSSPPDFVMSRLNSTRRIDLGNGKHLGPCVVEKSGFDIEDFNDLVRAITKHAKLLKTTDDASVKQLYRDAWNERQDIRWLETNEDAHDALTLSVFVDELRSHFCGSDWPRVVAEQRDKLTMKATGAGAFLEFADSVESLNNRLTGTNAFYNESQLLALIERNLIKGFRDYLFQEGKETTPTTVLKDWKAEVDDLERRSTKWRNPAPTNKRTDGSSHYDNTQPSKRGGTSQPSRNNQNRADSSGGSDFRFPSLKGLDDQRAFLQSVNACFRCRTLFADHKASDVDSNGNKVCPDAKLDVPWRPLTEKMVSLAKDVHAKTKQPILYSALLKQFPSHAPAVASVSHGPPLADLSGIVGNVAGNITAPAAVAFINPNPYGSFPVGFVQHDTELYRDLPLRRHSGPPNFASSSSYPARGRQLPDVGRRWIKDNDDQDDSDSEDSPSPVRPVQGRRYLSRNDSSPVRSHRNVHSRSPSIRRTMSNACSRIHTPVPDSGPTSRSTTPPAGNTGTVPDKPANNEA
jgi:hypothetical protein